MWRSRAIETTRGGLITALVLFMAVVPASSTLREAISSSKATGIPLSRYQTPYFKTVLIVDAQGTCLGLSEGGPALLFTPALHERFASSGAKGGKAR